jgi:hypothetical protein
MVIGQNKQEGRDFGDKFVVGNWQLYAQSPSLKKVGQMLGSVISGELISRRQMLKSVPSPSTPLRLHFHIHIKFINFGKLTGKTFLYFRFIY